MEVLKINELLLFDVTEKIKDTILKYAENNFYLSFSGGKDSTVLHYLLDLAIPDNKIPRVFCDTGIEYTYIHTYIHTLAKTDDRIKIIKPTQNINQALEKYGYPFKSKQHSHNLAIYQRNGKYKRTVAKYLGLSTKTTFLCPEKLKYQFTNNFKLKVNDKCCQIFKKEPFKKWEKENDKTITITGMRNDEGGTRNNLDCIIFDTKDNTKINKFHPIVKMTESWEDWFLEKYNIKLCELYYPPFNFKRTGWTNVMPSINHVNAR